MRNLGKKINAHFYWTLAAMVGLAGLIAKGFHWSAGVGTGAGCEKWC